MREESNHTGTIGGRREVDYAKGAVDDSSQADGLGESVRVVQARGYGKQLFCRGTKQRWAC